PTAAAAHAPVATMGVVETFVRREFAGWVVTARGAPPVRIEICVNRRPVAGTWASEKVSRRAVGEARSFRFSVYDLWSYTKRSDRITIEADGVPLPVAGNGTYYHPRTDGAHGADELWDAQERGYVFG